MTTKEKMLYNTRYTGPLSLEFLEKIKIILNL